MRSESVSRRHTLKLAATTAAALALLAQAAETKPGWIDAHSHIWPGNADRFPLAAGQTIADLKPASFTDAELLAIANPQGVDRVVLIQHSIYHLFDNAYLIDAARRRPDTFRIVGMVDDESPKPGEAMKSLLEQHVTGFRITPLIRKGEPQRWLETAGMHSMWKTAAETGQAMCCLINPADLPNVDAMCQRFPETPVVIDHLARIGVDGEVRERDVKQLLSLAKRKNVFVKVSAFYALGKRQPPYGDLLPMIKRVVEAFGVERLMWGSDSPYQLEGQNSYVASLELVRDQLPFLSAGDREHLLRRTAKRVFHFS